MFELLKSTTTPIIWVLAFMICGLILTRNKRRKSRSKLGWYLIFSGTLLLLFLSMPAIEGALIYSLERIYQPPAKDVLSTLDIVVVLGGGAWPSGVFSKYPEASGATYSRLFNGVEIFKQSSEKTLVLSGSESEVEVMKTLAIRLAVCEDKILTETKSCNTMQQIIELAKLLPPTEKMRIGIVTSALHMLRSKKSFRKKFSADAIVPIPVNYTYTPVKYNLESFIPSSGTFTGSTYALHEWIGIAWYAIRY